MKILAVLLNPTIDQIFTIQNFVVGGTFKVSTTETWPVGKAISFSLGIHTILNRNVFLKIIACIGKEEFPIYSNFLKEKNIEFDFVQIDGKTRSNTTIIDPIRGTTTHIRQQGFKLNTMKLREVIQLVKKNVDNGDFVIFSGSIPLNIDEDIYFQLISMCKEKGAVCVLDSSGNALKEGVKANPKILKPNLVELSDILQDSALIHIDFSNIMETCRLIAKKAKFLLNDKLEIILISLGEKGAICLTKDAILYGNVYIERILDTVGSGDSFLAGFISNYCLKKEISECFKLGIACGAANTLIKGPGMFKLKDVKKILKKVEIFRVN